MFKIDEQMPDGRCMSLEWENHTKYEIFKFAPAWVLKWDDGLDSCLNTATHAGHPHRDSPDEAPGGKWQCNKDPRAHPAALRRAHHGADD